MIRTYRIAHLERKLNKALMLLEELESKLPVRCPSSVWFIVGDLRRALSDVEDADIYTSPAGEQKEIGNAHD